MLRVLMNVLELVAFRSLISFLSAVSPTHDVLRVPSWQPISDTVTCGEPDAWPTEHFE